MGILDKLMFWKRKDEFSEIGLGDKDPFGKNNLAFGDDFGMGQGAEQPGFGQQSFGQQPRYQQQFPQAPSQQPSFSPQQFQQYQPPRYDYSQQDMASKNIEIVSSKIDAMRASLDSINQRLANIEALARGEDETRRRRY